MKQYETMEIVSPQMAQQVGEERTGNDEQSVQFRAFGGNVVIVNYDTGNSYGCIQAGNCLLPSTALMQQAFNHSGLALETS